MIRLLSLVILSLSSVSTVAGTFGSPSLPFRLPRGGSDSGDADETVGTQLGEIPTSGTAGVPTIVSTSSYASQLEVVKASVLEEAAESVRERIILPAPQYRRIYPNICSHYLKISNVDVFVNIAILIFVLMCSPHFLSTSLSLPAPSSFSLSHCQLFPNVRLKNLDSKLSTKLLLLAILDPKLK